jgi:DNA-binding NarL/FixJ family response regulator
VQFEEPDLSLVAFCSTIAPYPVLRLLDAGVRGIVLKRNPEQILLDALGSVYNGDDFYCQATWPLIQSLIAKRLFKPQDRSIKKLLSARESLILALICKGKTSKEIGNILCVGRRTVETHRGHLLEKTESNKMAELMRWAFENGF